MVWTMIAKTHWLEQILGIQIETFQRQFSGGPPRWVCKSDRNLYVSSNIKRPASLPDYATPYVLWCHWGACKDVEAVENLVMMLRKYRWISLGGQWRRIPWSGP